MKKAWNWMILVILAAGMMLPICAEALGRTGTVPRIILFTFYRQAGWGDRVQIGCVDENGGIWAGAGFDSTLKWPYKAEEQLAYLQSGKNLEKIGQMDSGKLFDLKGLVESVPDQGQKSYPAANDAGTEKSYAVQYDREGKASIILLGMSGDDCFENSDSGAQALYRLLRGIIPVVTSYGAPMGPGGFQPVPVSIFCKMENVDFEQVTITAGRSDCEAGYMELTVSDAERESIIHLMTNGFVTGKANASLVTGGTFTFVFSDNAGNYLGSIELYKGLLVRSDGMYSISK
ncbi:MAG: hypothetical protein J5889_02660 [Clostridia bacterium]|nr:hypothetical protein [Clostridia bacterium]